MRIKIDLAGLILEISGADQELFVDAGVLTPFLTEEDAQRQVTCSIVDVLEAPRGEVIFRDPGRWVYRDGDAVVSYQGSVAQSPLNGYIRSVRCPDRTEVTVKRSALNGRITPKILLKALEAEHLIVQNRGFLFHSSFISHNGRAILFTAPSGVGKSTQAALWQQLRGAEVMNGDRSVVRVGEDGVQVWGVPFSGSSGISRAARLPLAAIVYLSQAQETSIAPLTGVRAFRRVWEGCSVHTWDREDVALCSQTVMEAVSCVPVYSLACTPDESAVLALERVLNQGR